MLHRTPLDHGGSYWLAAAMESLDVAACEARRDETRRLIERSHTTAILGTGKDCILYE